MVLSPANIKGVNKVPKIYVGRSRVHDRTQSFILRLYTMHYDVIKSFLLVSFSVRSKELSCFVHGQRQKDEQKPTTKNFVGFHNIPPINYV